MRKHVFYLCRNQLKSSFMEQMNKAEIAGRIGTVRTAKVGERTVCHFSVATNVITRNAESGVVEETTWHNCSLWSGRKYPDLAFIKVGMPIHVSGRMRSNKYTGSDGVERTSCEIIVSEAEALPAEEPMTSINLA